MLVHKDETYTGRKYKQFSIIWRKTFLAHWSAKINFWRPKKFGVRERSPHSARGPHTGRGVHSCTLWQLDVASRAAPGARAPAVCNYIVM